MAESASQASPSAPGRPHGLVDIAGLLKSPKLLIGHKNFGGATEEKKKLKSDGTEKIEVLKVEVTRIELQALVLKELAELAGIDKLPLAKAEMKIQIRGVPTAFANGLRRVMVDEMKGRYLKVGESLGASGTNDPFMFDQFVRDRIGLIPLRPQISKEIVKNLRMDVHIENKTTSDMTVYSGDMAVVKGELTEPIFNPTFEIAFLQPGHSLHVEDIHIDEGYGRDFGPCQVGSLGANKHLDLKEAPREQTHAMDAPLADESGYAESSMLSNPRHHEVSITIPAIGVNPAEAVSVAIDACINIKERLKLIQNSLETESLAEQKGEISASAGKAAVGRLWGGGNIQFTLIDLEDGKARGVLWIGGETDTIGNILGRTVYEMVPTVLYCGYTCIRHENGVRLTVIHDSDVMGIVSRAIRRAHSVIDSIQRGIGETAITSGRREELSKAKKA